MTDPVDVTVLLRARGLGRGPWGSRPGEVVALYLASYLDERLATEENVTVEVDGDRRGGATYRVICDDAGERAAWEERIARMLAEFREEGWRAFPELVDASAAREMPR